MFNIDYRSRTPLYQQIIDNIERLALRGLLPPDSRLPSVRSLAVELSINPNTVSRAYSELETRGIIYSLPGRGNFVASSSELLREEARKQNLQKLVQLCRDVDAEDAGRESWLSLCSAAWDELQQSKEGRTND